MSCSKLSSQSKLFKHFKLKCLRQQMFSTSVATQEVVKVSNKMKAWQIHSYGGLEDLQFSDSVRMPVITDANSILIKVTAAGINPIDVAIADGYGAVLLNKLRQVQSCSCEPIVEFPLILGRDFSGKVVAKGQNVGSEIKVGDDVCGVTQPHETGCHAEYVVAHKNLVHKLPKNVDAKEACSVIYTGLTAWSALKITGDLAILPTKNKQVLVLGGSGGVGTVAIQLLKAWDAQVVATCHTDAIPLVKSLNADLVVDYSAPDHISELNSVGRYDIILDAAGLSEAEASKYLPLLKECAFAKYITLKSPLLRNIDSNGLVGGMILNGINLISNNLPQLFKGSSIRWGFFMPLNAGLRDIAALLESGEIMPVIHGEVNFSEILKGYETVKGGHLRGKVVVKMEDEQTQSSV